MWAQVRQKHNSLKFQFVTMELDLAITFSLIAATTNDQAKSAPVPIPVEKEKAYSPEKSVKEKARNL